MSAPADQRGFAQVPVAGVTLLALLVMLAVMGLLMGKAAETWDSQVRHELEEDLIQKGEEYKRAIEEYWTVNGRPPIKLEDLCPKESLNPRYIRRCWKDPITGKEFRRIAQGRAGFRALENRAKTGKNDEEERAEAQPEDHSLKGGFAPRRGRPGGPTASDVTFSLPGRESNSQMKNDELPFAGVASDSNLEGFREYNGATVYSEWEFYAVVTRVQPGLPGANPGQPGAIPGGPGGGVPGGAVLPNPGAQVEPDPGQ